MLGHRELLVFRDALLPRLETLPSINIFGRRFGARGGF